MLTTPDILHRAGLIDNVALFDLAIIKSRLAVDLESGAYLVAGGRNKYYLLNPPHQRRLIRATSVAEAIEKGRLR